MSSGATSLARIGAGLTSEQFPVVFSVVFPGEEIFFSYIPPKAVGDLLGFEREIESLRLGNPSRATLPRTALRDTRSSFSAMALAVIPLAHSRRSSAILIFVHGFVIAAPVPAAPGLIVAG